jgi:hypothetical protein
LNVPSAKGKCPDSLKMFWYTFLIWPCHNKIRVLRISRWRNQLDWWTQWICKQFYTYVVTYSSKNYY